MLKNKKMKQVKIFLLAVSIGIISWNCEKRRNFEDSISSKLNIITAISGNETEASIDDLQGVIDLVLPPRSDASTVTLTIEAPSEVEIMPPSGTVVDLTSTIEVTASVDGNTRTYQLFTRVLPNQIAFLGESATFEELLATADDDVIVAAQWVADNYAADFIYLDAAQVSFEDLESVNVVVFYYDQVGTSDLPIVFTEGTAKSAFIQYMVEGGKMLLGGMATSYAETIGRDQSGLLTIRGNGDGFDLDATWGIDGGVNFVSSKLNHPIYTFNEGLIEFDNQGFIPIMDPGFREDHNNLWDAASLLNPGHELGQFNEFENLFGGVVLAVWSGVSDECCPGIIEFLPVDPYAGTIICIGVGGMEWNMNDGRPNIYAGNIRGVYKNAIDYLQTK
jgi:hypothetical protein